MIITSVKKQKGYEFTSEMKDKYGSIENLEDLFQKSNNMKMYVDLRNWRYYETHLNEEIETSESIVLNNHC